ncbi:phage late control D family protein [Agathobaculum sp. Marseille-P7918]|uniref:phage late control D family protein n=1 Tax=Agathobaculum sp. Marseille-P7918 TaxID=2479843 RepID=UPI00356922F8
MDFSALYKQYDGMAAPAYTLKVGKAELQIGDDVKLLRAVCELTCRQNAGYLLVEAVMNPNGTNGSAWLDAFQIGAVGSFSLGYGSRKKAIFCGILYEVHWDEPLSQGPLGLEAVFLDVRGQLMHSACADAGSTRTLSQMIETILEQDCCKKLAASREIDKLPTDWDLPVQRSGLSDYEQLCRAASFLCYEFYAYADTLYFGPPRPVSSPVLTSSDTTGLIQLRRRNTLEHQCAAVAVSGADDQGKRIYVRHARSREHGFGCKQIRSALTNDLHQPEPTVRTMSQAQYLAKARMEQRQRQTAGLIGICLGAPELRPGRFIKVSGFSQAVNGTYYVYTVRHTLDAGGYKTDWEAEK